MIKQECGCETEMTERGLVITKACPEHMEMIIKAMQMAS